jgi:hypothetical protein
MANRLTNNNYIILYYSILYTIMLYICLVIFFDLSSGFKGGGAPPKGAHHRPLMTDYSQNPS